MEIETLKSSIEEYVKQLTQVNVAINATTSEPERKELCSLRDNLTELIRLSEENLVKLSKKQAKHEIEDEYALFMAEMAKEGAFEDKSNSTEAEETPTTVGALSDVEEDLKSLEGMKCRAPFNHSWGDKIYHNAMVCGTVSQEDSSNSTKFEEINVRVMFTNPTHQEMLPCPYFLNTDCKFSDEKCRFSHGEIVPFSSLQEYLEPNFQNIKIGSKVLAKQDSGLWLRASIKRLYSEKCLVTFESNRKEVEVELKEIFPLLNKSSNQNDNASLHNSSSSDSSNSDDSEVENENEIMEIKVFNPLCNDKLGDWEQYTKGIGSKLMQQMGYIVGTGLGKQGEGRVEPVSAVILPSGKSLDYCMELRENAGGDKDLFSVERRLKRQKKKQEAINKKVYEDIKKKESGSVFNFLNKTLSKPKNLNDPGTSKSTHRQQIKSETNRELNVASLKTEENIKHIEKDIVKLKQLLNKHKQENSPLRKNLLAKLRVRENELLSSQNQMTNYKNELSVRHHKKKLTLF